MSTRVVKYIKKRFEKENGRFKQIEENEDVVSFQFYENVVNSKSFFESLGGQEKHTKNYTMYGYIVTKIVSISPDRNTRIEWEFDFI